MALGIWLYVFAPSMAAARPDLSIIAQTSIVAVV